MTNPLQTIGQWIENIPPAIGHTFFAWNTQLSKALNGIGTALGETVIGVEVGAFLKFIGSALNFGPWLVQEGVALQVPPVVVTNNPPLPDPLSGYVDGRVVFADPTGGTLTITGSTVSTGGAQVAVGADGTYVYAPTDAQRQSANTSTTDTFTVTAAHKVAGPLTDLARVLYGVFGIGSPGELGRSTTETVTVKVLPVISSTIDSGPDPDTGKVTGTLSVPTGAGTTIVYSTLGTSKEGGTVTVDPTTGKFTYTPAATTTATSDVFLVSASIPGTSYTIEDTITVPIGQQDSLVGAWLRDASSATGFPTITIRRTGDVYTAVTDAPFNPMNYCDGCNNPTMPAGIAVGTFTRTGNDNSSLGPVIIYSGTLTAEYIEAWNNANAHLNHPDGPNPFLYVTRTVLDASVPLMVKYYPQAPGGPQLEEFAAYAATDVTYLSDDVGSYVQTEFLSIWAGLWGRRGG